MASIRGTSLISEKPNPNNPVVFFDVKVGNTVSRMVPNILENPPVPKFYAAQLISRLKNT